MDGLEKDLENRKTKKNRMTRLGCGIVIGDDWKSIMIQKSLNMKKKKYKKTEWKSNTERQTLYLINEQLQSVCVDRLIRITEKEGKSETKVVSVLPTIAFHPINV